MGEELDVVEPESRELVLPATGELVDLDDPLACAVAIDEMYELEQRLKEARKILSRTLVAEAERQGTNTVLRLPGAIVKLRTPSRTEWDLDELEKLRDLGLPEERYNALVRETVSHKVMASEAARIGKANPRYAEVIERARHDFDGEPYVTEVEVQR